MQRNDRLRAAREAIASPRVPGACASRTELAELVNAWLATNTTRPGILDDAYVARLERGRIRWPNSDYRAAFRAVLGAQSDAELGFHPTGSRRVPVRPVENPYRAADPSTPPGPTEPASDPRSSAATDVTAIRAMAGAFMAADRQVGGGVLYGSVSRYLATEIGPRLVDASGTAGDELFAAACSLTHIAGWFAHDAGNDTAARRHFDRAYRLATAAEHAALAANVCASMSHLAGQLNQPTDATRIAEAGLTRARGVPGTTRLVARLHAMRARATAARGERAATVASLNDAERTLASAGSEVPAEWIAGFDEAALANETALCLRELGDLDGAQRHAERVIALRSGDRVRSRAFGQLTLAGVLVDAGRMDEAAAIGSELCEVAASLTSARVRSRLDALGAVLRPHATTREVATFLSDLAAVTPTPAPTSGWPV